MDDTKLHVAVLTSPGMGHLIPVILLGNRLVNHRNVNVTILVVTTNTSPEESKIRSSLASRNHLPITEIPSVDISDVLDSDANVVTRLAVIMRETRPNIRSAISAMNPRPNVLIGDLFSTEAWPIADEFNIPKYVFVTTTAWFVGLTTYCQILDKEVKGQYVDQKESLKIPGCKPVRPEDVVDPMLDRNTQQYYEYVRQGIGYSLSDGILINTWGDLESITLDALRNDEVLHSVVKAPVYPIGPIYRPNESAGSKTELIEWLNMQPTESVLYVSFWSGGTLSAEQMTELAWGLELSQQRFVWVVRPPMGGGADGSFFTAGSCPDGPPDYLPERFLSRTSKMGVVVPQWAPQVEILNHPSVGGFLPHCGWNSTLESIASRVPMIAWPLYAEQKLNATMLTEELKVAVRPEVWPAKKVVERHEIERMVRSLMQNEEGKAMREKVKEIRHSAEEALNIGGSSNNSMCEFIKNCWMKIESLKATGHNRIQ